MLDYKVKELAVVVRNQFNSSTLCEKVELLNKNRTRYKSLRIFVKLRCECYKIIE